MIPCSPNGSYQHFKGIQYHHYCCEDGVPLKCHYPQTTITHTSEEFSINANLYHYENLKSDDQIQFIMVCFPAEAAAAARNFFLLQSIQICSAAHPASYSVSTIGTLPKCKEARYESDHLLPPRAMAKNKWSYTASQIVTYIAKTYIK
jgi:hypothetical protein